MNIAKSEHPRWKLQMGALVQISIFCMCMTFVSQFIPFLKGWTGGGGRGYGDKGGGGRG